MRGNGGFIGIVASANRTTASGEWSLREQMRYKSQNLWPNSTDFTYVGFTSGHVDDTGDLATISFPGGTTVGDIAVVSVNVDDYSTTIKSSISGWTTVYADGGQGTYIKTLDVGDISSPPSLLSSIDSNAWICYVIRGSYNTNNVYNVQHVDNLSFPSSTDLTAAISSETNNDIIVFAGAGGKREILDTMVVSIGGTAFDQWQQINFPATAGIAVREFAFKRFIGGSYTNKLIDFNNTNINSFNEILFYIRRI